MKKRIFMAVILLLTARNTVYAGGGLTGGATELTQQLNNAELVKQVEEAVKTVNNQITQITNQITQITNQITQIENMVFNTMNLPNQILSQFSSVVSNIRGVADNIEGIAYQVANLGERFQNQFKGFQTTMNYIEVYKDLAQKTRETSEAAIKVIENVAKSNETDSHTLEQLSEMSGSAQGHQQAIQAGNQILSFLGEQLMKLQELNMSYSTAVIEQIQAKNEKEERIEANLQEMHKGFKAGADALVD